MRTAVSRGRLVLVVVTVVALAAALAVRFTDVCQLEAVTLNSEAYDDWEADFGLSPSKSILDQPVGSLASELLSHKEVFKVDVDYRLPHTMNIRTNDFTPVCFVVDKNSGELHALSAHARVVSLSASTLDWEHPVLCNVVADRLYGYCDDPRVRIVVPQLMRLRRSNVDLYRLLEEIDFAQKEYLVVTVAGLPYRLMVSAEGLLYQINQFVYFLEQFDPNLDGTRLLDMRFENMIIRVGEGERGV